ncbi:MAG: hypothetical protein ABIM31_06710 [candidate division WOR-3 bacterium]
MGEKISKIFQIVEKYGGTAARIQLAQKTGITASKALDIEETDELLKKVKDIASQLLGKRIEEFDPNI